MADTRRILRLQQLMLETLATALQQQVEDPRVKGATITRVKLASDLTTGIVYWSNLQPDGPRRTAERGLTDALPYLQALVAEALGTRQTPRLTLRFDDNIERSSRLGELFAKIADERGESPAAPAGTLAAELDEDEEEDEEDEDDEDDKDDEDEDDDEDDDEEDEEDDEDDKDVPDDKGDDD